MAYRHIFDSILKNQKMNTIKTITYLILGVLLTSCNAEESPNKNDSKPTKLSLPEKVALFYGLSDFEQIKSIAFTFNVQKNDKQVSRHWKWTPATNQISLYVNHQEIHFVHNSCNSPEELDLDKKFINDSYWLLFPYHLEWDKNNYKYSIEQEITAPISKQKSTKLTLTYLNDDGYSPNDEYELFLNDKNEITEWIYRKNGSLTPTKITTWEKTKSFEGVKIATQHKSKTTDFKVWFDQIKIIH